MSHLTFNIADYRPPFPARNPYEPRTEKPNSAFVVLSSNSEPREYEVGWLNPPPPVIEIHSVRETHRPVPRRGKILRFSNPDSHRVYTMPMPESGSSADDDPGPLVA